MQPTGHPSTSDHSTTDISDSVRPDVRPEAVPIQRAAELFGSQYGVASRAQLIRCGLTARQLERRVAGGSLRRVTKGVYRVPGIDASWEQRAIAALLTASHRVHPSALSHRSAAAAWNLPGFERRGEIQLTAAPEDRHPNPLATIIRAVDLESADVVVGPLGVPTTSLERTILDLAVRAGTTQQLNELLDGVLADDRVDIEALWTRVSQMGGRPGIVAVRRAVRVRVRRSRRATRRRDRTTPQQPVRTDAVAA